MAATQTMDEAAQAREAVALRLLRLVRRIRAGTITDLKALDEAYAEVIKLTHQIKDILG